ncbi:hypothetical protein N0V83_002769 [Neocucurbitaria cava]|uniref:Uncharacterized protein n=1 Tax=Neocucurbitaria cava TaxID=798079 RepID=A0A9W8YC55_9PLEO|nr:hypothetical protein N0V83_002769 [Neocucurbitaria cava]
MSSLTSDSAIKMVDEQDGAVEGPVQEMEKLGLSDSKARKKGFLDLPGELRNEIYELVTYHRLPFLGFVHLLPLIHSCRQVRKELMPFCFSFCDKQIEFCRVQRFFEVFFLSSIPNFVPKQPEMYKVLACVPIEEEDHTCARRTPDLKWLLEFLIQYPKIPLLFSVSNDFYGGETFFYRLRDTVRSNPAWLKHIQDFESIEMWLEDRHPDRFMGGRVWYLDLVLKPEVAEPWWNDEEERSKQTQELLTELGLYEMCLPDEHSRYKSLVVNVGNGAYCRHSDYYNHHEHYLREHKWNPLGM